MTAVAAHIQGVRTIAQLLRDLGDVAPERVLLEPAPGHATEEDVAKLAAHADRLCELVDGALVEKAIGYKESFLAIWIATALRVFVQPKRLGLVTGEAGMMRLRPGMVRIPDVAFVRRTEGKRVADEPVPMMVPTLAVEILSEGNTQAEMDRKVEDYFKAGSEVVWIIDPEKREGRVYRSVQDVVVVDGRGTMSAAPALEGFAISLGDMFEEMDGEFEG